MTRDEAASIMQVIVRAWPKRLDQDTVVVYIKALLDLPYDAGKTAVTRLMRSSEFPPTIAAIRREAMASLGLLAPPMAGAVAQAAELMAYVEQVQHSNGSGWQPAKPEVHPAVELACAGLSPSGDWMRGFSFAYREVAKTLDTETISGTLSLPHHEELTDGR